MMGEFSVRSFYLLSRDRQGIAAIEYALMASLMCVIIIAVFPSLQAPLQTVLTAVATHLTTLK